MGPLSINKILIANRSEIALRIMNTAQAMGIECVAIYSRSDSNSLHVKQADEAYSLDADTAAESYLNIEKVIAIAKASQCDAIHPGYGFLAENAAFASACEDADIIFIGPKAETIDLMGDKARAKAFAKKNNIPVIPGEENLEQSLDNFKKLAKQIGVPLLLKASAGGGGKGMKLVKELTDLESAYNSAKREALSAFGDDNLLIEKYFEFARHVEVQVLADQHGNVVHLFDRDCSLQRRHQKVIEEAPAYGISEDTRNAMYECAIKLCKLIEYRGAGTLEFLMDEKENFYLMEMNTRLQVEHAVSEQITGIDLVREQILVASGKALSFSQNDIKQQGHSIEARLYAEQTHNGFLPASGHIHAFSIPRQNKSIRIDHALYTNMEVGSLYDPMIGKIACWAASREDAIKTLSRTIQDTQLIGIETNREFVKACIEHQAFKANQVSTRFIDTHLDTLLQNHATKALLTELACTLFENAKLQLESNQHPLEQFSPWHQVDDFRINDKADKSYRITVKIGKEESTLDTDDKYIDKEIDFIPISHENNRLIASWKIFKEKTINGLLEFKLLKNKHAIAELLLSCSLGDVKFSFTNKSTEKKHNQQDMDSKYLAPLNGRVIAVNVSNGEKVTSGQELIVIEAMKMEHPIKAKSTGVVENISVTLDQQISAEQFLCEIINTDDASDKIND